VREPLDAARIEREAAAEPLGEGLRRSALQRAEVIREPLAEIPDELLEEIQIGELIAFVEDEVRSLGERPARAQLAPPTFAEPLGVAPGAEPVERGFQFRAIDAEQSGGLGEHPARGPHGVEDLVPLPGLERAGHAVPLEQAVQVLRQDGETVWPSPVCGQRRADPSPSGAVLADEAREDGASLLDHEVVQQGE
jgi:hypothetical protein